MRRKDIIRVTGLPILVASLCCLSPVILVVLGLSSVSFAASLANTLYGTYKWVFRGAGLLLLCISLFLYFRRTKGICTLDEAKKRRNEIINIVALTLIAGIVGYFVWLYIVVEFIGKVLRIWR